MLRVSRLVSRMQRLTLPLAICLALLSACATPPAPELTGTNWISIQTQTGPFCGRCSNTKLGIQEDGLVHIEQGYWPFDYRFWQTRRRTAQIAPETISAFRSHLEPFRPEGTLDLRDPKKCETYRTDSDGAQIRWHDAEGEDELYADFGCQSEQYPVSRCDIIKAVTLLGIEKLRQREWDWANCN